MVAAALADVVAPTEATALLPCAVATVALLVATLPEAEATVVVTVAAAAPPVAATTPTERRPARTMIETARASKRRLQTACGKSPRRT